MPRARDVPRGIARIAFMTRNFSSTEPFTPMVEYMIALRRLRFAAAEEDNAAAPAPIAVSFKNVLLFIKPCLSVKGGWLLFPISSGLLQGETRRKYEGWLM